MPNFAEDNMNSYSPLVSADHNSNSETDIPQWFALAVKPRFDKVVARTLANKGYETLLPMYKKRHTYAARNKESELALFPGYVFCRFNVLTRLPILTTPGVTQILGMGNRPSPLSEAEMFSLQKVLDVRFPLRPFPFFQAGQRVRIEGGMLTGVVGIVIRIKDSLRLILSISLLQRSVLLEIDGYQVSLEPERHGGLWREPA
jgi:transcription antitermination factor NusG